MEAFLIPIYVDIVKASGYLMNEIACRAYHYETGIHRQENKSSGWSRKLSLYSGTVSVRIEYMTKIMISFFAKIWYSKSNISIQ